MRKGHRPNMETMARGCGLAIQDEPDSYEDQLRRQIEAETTLSANGTRFVHPDVM
jgi:hypothetical protein